MSFQLFPPPPKKQKPINLKRPVQPSSPEPAVELLERAKAPVDFHELVIRVNNSNPSSPISAPPEAHVGSSTVGKSQPKVTIPEKIKSASQSSTPQTRSRSSTLRSGDGRTTPSSSGIAGRSPDTSSPGQHPPVTGDTISPSSQADRQYTASPSFSDATTLVRNQSTATHKTKLSQVSPKETPVMRSIFPRHLQRTFQKTRLVESLTLPLSTYRTPMFYEAIRQKNRTTPQRSSLALSGTPPTGKPDQKPNGPMPYRCTAAKSVQIAHPSTGKPSSSDPLPSNPSTA
ncbi:hypothetical protein MPH_02843 [Macrophomina phaseolina MS6]|uniref:Uncharacterized protein n=1 Tax=Macrophomina phaseolina (strain MS6) TaxID=1126212 RepID=K2RBE9_MACPH|nr:hypothetical protein MPH_02843 [Macrophomina phaseolina MS6]